jgi:hypothetical protein
VKVVTFSSWHQRLDRMPFNRLFVFVKKVTGMEPIGDKAIDGYHNRVTHSKGKAGQEHSQIVQFRANQCLLGGFYVDTVAT